MILFGKRVPKLYLLFVLLFTSIFFSSCKKETELTVNKGLADLRNKNIKGGEIYQLNGEWEFYYGQLLTPEDFSDSGKIHNKDFIHVPESWTEQNNKKYPKYGCATYKIKILTDDTVSQTIFICKRIFSAYKIWLNGKLLWHSGKVSETSVDYQPELRVLTPNPEYLRKENQLIIQVANYSDLRAGILRPVSIGEVHTMLISTISQLIVLIAVMSIIFIISIYHLILFLFRRRDLSNLLFSVLGMIFITVGLIGNDTLLKNILLLDFTKATRLFHLSVSVYPALITGFFYLLFKEETSKKFLLFIVFASVILSIFSLSFNIAIVRTYVGIKILLLLTVSVYFLGFSLPKAIKNKKQGALWAFMGMLILFLTNINDVLFSLDILRTGYIAAYGFVIYIFFQSMNIAERFSFSYKKNKKLAENLKDQNSEYIALNEMYKEQNEDLKKAKEEAENADKLKSAFLANMSHEIRTPMNAVIGFSNLLSAEKIDDERRRKLASYIIKGGNTLLKLINDIIDISKIEAGELEITKNECTVSKLFEELEHIYSENSDLKNMSELNLIFDNKSNPDFLINTDSIRLKQVLINLIDNALKFTEKGFVKVSYKQEGENQIIFSVKDTGIGMSDKQKKLIFNRFTKLENEGEKLYRGAGLGLSISENIIKLLGGEIWLESEINKGTSFYFSLPIQ